MIGTIEPPCGVPAHRMGRWENEVLGIWWCPDCGEEIWATEGTDDSRQSDEEPTQRGAAPAPTGVGGALGVPGVPGGAADGGAAAGASRDRAPGDGGARLWHLIVETFGRERS